MSNRRHMIHRQLFELTACTAQPAWEWDRVSADFHRDLLLPVLEACFSEADKSGEHLVIDRIEVDLGVFGGREDFVKQAGDRLRERLVLGIREKRQEASANGSHRTSTSSLSITTIPAAGKTDQQTDDNRMNPAGKTKRSESGLALMHEKEAPVAAFLYFLRSGRLPWWFEHMGTDCFGDAFQEGLMESDIRNIASATMDEQYFSGSTGVMCLIQPLQASGPFRR